MFKFATLFAGVISAAAGDTTTTAAGGSKKVGAAIEKLIAPTALKSDTDGTAEFVKYELLQYKKDTTKIYRTYTVETEWDPTNVTAGSESWVYGAYFEFKPEDPCTMKFRFYEDNNETTAATSTSAAKPAPKWIGDSPALPCTATDSFKSSTFKLSNGVAADGESAEWKFEYSVWEFEQYEDDSWETYCPGCNDTAVYDDAMIDPQCDNSYIIDAV